MSIAKRIKIKELIGSSNLDYEATVMGWVRTKRDSKNAVFVTLNDGSTIESLQIVVDPSKFQEELIRKITTGASLCVVGHVIKSLGSGQKYEVQAKEITILGESDPEKYPLQPKRHSLEFLREIAHLRPRTNTFSAIFRIRHAMSYAIHTFFHERGFYYIHTPIITASDAEGAGETFHVTTLDISSPPRNSEGSIDYKEDFFGKEANLTVSGQLEGELAATALGEVYTFGPTFRAENSNTTRHLAEFWMIEPEMAFYDLEDNMNLVEDMLHYLVRYALENCNEDLLFLSKRAEEESLTKPQAERDDLRLIDRLKFVSENKFVRITYTEAIEILMNSTPNKKKKFQYPVEKWGTDLQSEHERYLVEKHFKKPVILYNYPKEIKAFYMRNNDDGRTVAAMDVLFPGIGEIVGGSQREERYEKLLARMMDMHIPSEEMWWYLDTRRFGTVPHSGFGLGFERMILFITGMGNIRDVIPFPRTPGNCEF